MPPTSNDPQQRNDLPYVWGVCGFLLLAVALIYGQTLDHRLLDYDDNVFVYDNPHVTPGLTGAGIWWAFTEGPAGEWYPLAPLSHMLDCQLFGVKPWGHHLTNVLLHAATSIALFLVWRRFTGELWPSALVATVFAIHPQHVESVAWVAERRDVLSGFFFVLTLGAWLGYVRGGQSVARYGLAAALFALGLMAKPMLVTLPPLLLLLDFWPLARIGAASDTPAWTRKFARSGVGRLVLEKLPLATIAAADCLMTLRTHASGGVVVAWLERLGNGAVSCVTYLFQFFYPVDLAAFYPTPPGGPLLWKVVGAVATMAGISAAAVIWRRRCPYAFVGWFWYLGMLSPVLGLVKVSEHAMADRYMYLPGIGLYIALAWGATRLAAGSLAGRWTLGACAGLAIAGLVILATWQTSFWRDDETLWRHALACTTANGEAELGLADALTHLGRVDAAITHYRQAQKYATDAAPFNNLGSLLAQQGRLDEALAEFRRALEIEPKSYRAHANLGLAFAQRNQLGESEEHFRRAVELDPRIASSHRALAHVLLLEGKLDEARVEAERAVELDPRDIVAHNDLGEALLAQGKAEAAIPQFEAALAVDSEFLPALVGLGRALEARGQLDEAADCYGRALEIDSRNPPLRQHLDQLRRGNAGPLAP